MPVNEISIAEQLIRREEEQQIRRILSQMSENYRKTLVCFYYDELPLKKIAAKLSMTEGMVKYYLCTGRKKLKEAYHMQIGQKSFNPSPFTVYKTCLLYTSPQQEDDNRNDDNPKNF